MIRFMEDYAKNSLGEVLDELYAFSKERADTLPKKAEKKYLHEMIVECTSKIEEAEEDIDFDEFDERTIMVATVSDIIRKYMKSYLLLKKADTSAIDNFSLYDLGEYYYEVLREYLAIDEYMLDTYISKKADSVKNTVIYSIPELLTCGPEYYENIANAKKL